jgi:putative endonuclease
VSWHVYIVRCADDSLYTGCTNDLTARIATHNAGKGARYTRSRLPVEVVLSVRVKDRSAALSREAKLKQLTRTEKLELIARRKRRG